MTGNPPSRSAPFAAAALLAAALAATPLAATPLAAAEYRSSLGFHAQVPETWLIVSRDTIRANPELFQDVSLPGADPLMVEAIRARIERGEIDFLFRVRTGGDGADFADNINALAQPGTLPGSAEELRAICPQFAAALTGAFGRDIELHACELREPSGRDALYVEFDGSVPGTRSAQYQIAGARGGLLVLTATADGRRTGEVFADLDALVGSLAFD